MKMRNWTHINKHLPSCYRSGDFDGLQSDLLLIKDKSGKIRAGYYLSGRLDGSVFGDFYDTDDMEIKNVEYWVDISEFEF